MNTSEAIRIIDALANGINPTTGELLEEDSLYNNPMVIRALFTSLKALERLDKADKKKRDLPGKAGKAWTEEEEKELTDAFDQGIPISEIADRHARTKGAITSRLVKLGRIEPPAPSDFT